jgi:hypothetical protein
MRIKTELYLFDIVPGAAPLQFVNLVQGRGVVGDTLFTNIPTRKIQPVSYAFTPDIDRADYMLFPHALKSKNDPLLTDLVRAQRLAEKHELQLIVFVGGDLSHDIFIDDAIVLKGSK